MKLPCARECPERSESCHATCERYNEWKRFNDARRNAGREAVEAAIFRKVRREMREKRKRGNR